MKGGSVDSVKYFPGMTFLLLSKHNYPLYSETTRGFYLLVHLKHVFFLFSSFFFFFLFQAQFSSPLTRSGQSLGLDLIKKVSCWGLHCYQDTKAITPMACFLSFQDTFRTKTYPRLRQTGTSFAPIQFYQDTISKQAFHQEKQPPSPNTHSYF